MPRRIREIELNIVRTSILAVVAVVVVGAAIYTAKYRVWVTIPKAREPLLSHLKDPGGAQFKNERITSAGVLCGEVNSKNSMGGYVGFKRFILAGPGANYIEDGGPLGKWSAPDFLARLNEENAVLKRLVGYQKEFPGTPIPSESERQEMAVKHFFDRKWDEMCDPVRP